MKKFTFLWALALCFTVSLSAQHLTTMEELELLESTRAQTIQNSDTPDIGELLNRQIPDENQVSDLEAIYTLEESRFLNSHYKSQNRDVMADIIPTAGAAETFTPDVGDFFFDPGGPGGGPDGTPGNYPNCGCLTETTLAGVTELEFLDYEVFGTFDWLRVYDGADNTGVLLFDNSTGGNGANTYAQLLAANGGSGVFTGTSGDFFFEFFATTVVNRLGWEVEILATGGGGGGGGCTAGDFASRPAFEAAFSGSLNMENFAGPSGIIACDGPINTSGNSCYAPGSILDGISVTTSTPAEPDPMVFVQAGSFGNTVDLVGANQFLSFTIIEFPNGDVDAFGFDLISLTGGGNVDIRIFGATSGLLETLTVNATSQVFFGYIASEILDRVEIEDLTGANAELIGMLAFGLCDGTGGGGGDCDTVYYDSGGPTGNYSNNEDIVTTFFPDNPGDVVTVTFNFVDIETSAGTGTQEGCWDFLTVYDGPDITSPIIANTLCGRADGSVPSVPSSLLSIGDSFTSTHPSGAITFRFRSDGSVTLQGWDADVTCSSSGPTNNWECADATALSCGDVSVGTTAGATNSGGNASPDVFYSYTGSGDAELVTISLCDGGTTYDSFLRVYESCADLSIGAAIASNDDFCGLQSQLTFESDGTTTYIIMVEGFGTASGNYSLAITCEPVPVLECGGQFVDSGGPTGNYSNNEDITWTISPDNVDDFVTVIFTAFDVEANWDALYVFDGPDTSSPLISSGNPPTTSGFPAGGYYGTTIPGPFASTHPTGALTFRFLSDGSVTRPGWIADIVCAPVPPPNDLIENAISVTSETQPYVDPAVRLQFATNELLNPDGCAIAGTNGVWYSFTAEVDGTANASITTPAGTSAVIFYEAPSEAVGDETDLSFSPEPDNQCAPSTASVITTVAGQSYYIFVLNTGGPSDVVIDISDSLLGTNDNTIDGFTFYPNPTMDVLNLRSNITIDTVEFFNMLGQKVISQSIGATTSQVDVSNLATGTYLMKVNAEGQTATYQIIKK